ncbi:hypothetical protein [Demequina flava]|uniref:hypothetical protein n=1 Tax=Demequina flava TaxID=1095025 RepID=UPI000782178E|nr:hypothetical protein [Demequina flava]
MFVVTADQRGSTRVGNRVEELLTWFDGWAPAWADDIALPLERTVGDEVQTVLTTPESALDLALSLMRHGNWSVGIGAGEVELPLADSSRASSGPAFIYARRAVERARGKAEPTPLVVAGSDEVTEERATAVVQLLGAVVRKRSDAGWEVADLAREGLTQKAIAHRLDISAQAVSQRSAAALLDEEQRARPVATYLLSTAARGALDTGHVDRDAGQS